MSDTSTNLSDALNESLGGASELSDGNSLEDFATELADGTLEESSDVPGEGETSESEASESEASGEPEDLGASEGTEEAENSEESEEEGSEGADEDEVPEDPPKGASKKASEDWKKLRGSRDKYKEQATNLERAVEAKEKEMEALQRKVQELQELEGKAALSEEYEEKLKKFDELEKQVAMLDVRKTEAYKKAITEPLEALDGSVKALAKSNETEVNALYKALNEPDLAEQRVALKELTAGWDEIEKMELWDIAKNVRAIYSKQDEMEQNAHAAAKEAEQLSQVEREKQKAAFQKEFSTAAESILGDFKEKAPFVPLRDGETVDRRFAAIAEKLKQVDFDSANAREKAYAAASALMLPQANLTIAKLQKEKAALEARLDKKQQTKPGAAPKEKKPEAKEKNFWEGVGMENPMKSYSLQVSL